MKKDLRKEIVKKLKGKKNKRKGGRRIMKECLWYNGETGCYELLDFNQNELETKEGIRASAEAELRRKYGFDDEEIEKVMETVYLLDIDCLESVK